MRRTGADDLSVQPRLTNVVSRTHGLSVELPRELARSRRHGHAFSLILVHGDAPDADLHQVIDRLALRLRLSDLLILLDDDRLLVACPETNAAGARVLLGDVVELIAAEGVDARAGTATFPTSALTASELLRACEADLTDGGLALEEPADPWTEEETLRIVSDGGRHR